jgi:hypothetical protein
MSSDNRLRHNPEDLELVRETMPQDVKEWVARTIERMAGKVSAGLLHRLPDPHGALLPLLDAMVTGDALWLCRSRQRGVLHGHQGIALVRDGQPIIYLPVVNC